MVTVCWAAKGGSGTTVVAVTLALTTAAHALLVDLDGEIPAALGLPEPDRPGVLDWLVSDASPSQLADLVVDIGGGTSLLPARVGGPPDVRIRIAPARWRQLATWLAEQHHDGVEVVVDAGTGSPRPELVEIARRSLLVTRPCYLSLRRLVRSGHRPTGIVLVSEPGRSITPRDVEHAVGAPVVATVSIDPAVARAVDAGLLAARLPRVIRRELRGQAA